MNWLTLDENVRRTAERVLSPKQLVAYKLDANGMSEARIAVFLRISRRSVRDRLVAADIKIALELEREAA